MSSWRAVLIRILALLQRKTLIEKKNRTLKCLNGTIGLTEYWAFALFFRPHPGRFDSSREGKKNANARGSGWGGGQGAAGID